MSYPGQNVLLTITGVKAQDIFNWKIFEEINSVETYANIELSIGNGVVETDPAEEEGMSTTAVSYLYTIPLTVSVGDTYKIILKPSGTTEDIAEVGKVEFDLGTITDKPNTVISYNKMSFSMSMSF